MIDHDPRNSDMLNSFSAFNEELVKTGKEHGICLLRKFTKRIIGEIERDGGRERKRESDRER